MKKQNGKWCYGFFRVHGERAWGYGRFWFLGWNHYVGLGRWAFGWGFVEERRSR
jgi:hypothetical protein